MPAWEQVARARAAMADSPTTRSLGVRVDVATRTWLATEAAARGTTLAAAAADVLLDRLATAEARAVANLHPAPMIAAVPGPATVLPLHLPARPTGRWTTSPP